MESRLWKSTLPLHYAAVYKINYPIKLFNSAANETFSGNQGLKCPLKADYSQNSFRSMNQTFSATTKYMHVSNYNGNEH